MHKIGGKPDKCTYQCTICGEIAVLDDDSDLYHYTQSIIKLLIISYKQKSIRLN